MNSLTIRKKWLWKYIHSNNGFINLFQLSTFAHFKFQIFALVSMSSFLIHSLHEKKNARSQVLFHPFFINLAQNKLLYIIIHSFFFQLINVPWTFAAAICQQLGIYVLLFNTFNKNVENFLETKLFLLLQFCVQLFMIKYY